MSLYRSGTCVAFISDITTISVLFAARSRRLDARDVQLNKPCQLGQCVHSTAYEETMIIEGYGRPIVGQTCLDVHIVSLNLSR